MAAKRTSAELIRELQGRGYSQRQIAAAIDRSPSYVSRIVRGKTPGNLVREGLVQLSRRKGVPEKGREPAPVRVPRVRGRRRVGGAVVHHRTRDTRQIGAVLRRSLAGGKRVRVTVWVTGVRPLRGSPPRRDPTVPGAPYRVDLFPKGGTTAGFWMGHVLVAGGDVGQGLLDAINDPNVGRYRDADGFIAASVTVED